MNRHLINLAFFTLAFIATFCTGLKAYASTATGPNGPFSFEGNTCDELRKGHMRRHYTALPTDAYYDYFGCANQFVKAGDVVSLFVNSGGNVSSFQVTVNSVDLPQQEGSYLGFVGLACCFGIGVMAGKQA